MQGVSRAAPQVASVLLVLLFVLVWMMGQPPGAVKPLLGLS